MDGITNEQVVASNIYSTGKGTLRIVSGVVGNALDFSMGSGKYVDMGTFESSCIGNPSLCTFGLSISFWLRFISGQTNAYVFSNNASGLAVYLNGSTLNASIQKGGQRWFVSASGLINESWYFVEVTWHPNSGLGLYLNQSMASSQVSGTVVTQGATGSANLYLGQIGGNMSNRSNAMMTIDDLYIYNADRQQLLNINYIIRGIVLLDEEDDLILSSLNKLYRC
ncbi:hypothetical protein DPMN_031319 [Dreissena polymorpha]|uniref:Uncharacterized protein n=1 Tax=Dreissena polymorpha TaxID=45954 RepID=A0A9D4M2K2_DREPO|nr:hypothetical protein DPMN_031319 [Dreissena polymorpha]